ncbi:MAG: hypothetical protein Q9187_004835, partial [Circinaria calcarea]
ILCDCQGEDHKREIDHTRPANVMAHWIHHLPAEVTLPHNAQTIMDRDSRFLDTVNGRFRDRATDTLNRIRHGMDPIDPATNVPELDDDPDSPPALSGPSSPDSDWDETRGPPALTSHPPNARRPRMGRRERMPIDNEPIYAEGEIMDDNYDLTEWALGSLAFPGQPE